MVRNDRVSEDERLPASGDDPRSPGRPLQSRLARTLIAAVVVVAVGGVAVVAVRIWGGDPVDRPPLIAAPAGSIKARPANPGGAAIPDRDKEIFERLDGRGPRPAERLLPRPEEPVRKRTKSASAPVAVPAGDAVREAPSPKPEARTPAAVPATNPLVSREMPEQPAPRPSVSEEAPKKAALQPRSATVPRPDGRFMIQLSSLRSEGAVRRAWLDLQRRHQDLLGGLSLNIRRALLDGEKQAFYRMRAGPLSTRKAAKDLCSRLKARQLDCLVVGR